MVTPLTHTHTQPHLRCQQQMQQEINIFMNSLGRSSSRSLTLTFTHSTVTFAQYSLTHLPTYSLHSNSNRSQSMRQYVFSSQLKRWRQVSHSLVICEPEVNQDGYRLSDVSFLPLSKTCPLDCFCPEKKFDLCTRLASRWSVNQDVCESLTFP